MTDTDSTKNLIGDDQSVANTELQVTLPELPGGLATISPPIGIDTSRVVDQPLDLDMKYKMSSWSGRDWTVTDQQGKVWYTTDGKAKSMKGSTDIKDATGAVVLSLVLKSAINPQRTYIATDPQGNEVFRMKDHSFTKTDFRAELTPPGATESLHLDLTGNFWGTHGQLVHDGKVLAQARMSKKGYKYRILVAPGVDPVLCVGMIVGATMWLQILVSSVAA